eukprot:s881_g5.t1
MRRVKQSCLCLSALAGLAAISSAERRRRSQDCVLSSRRAVRAAVCVARIAARYKHLAWTRSTKPGDAQLYELQRSKVHRECAEIALRMCSCNGGMFVKMGQHAATLGPAVPAEYVEALVSLQDQAPAGSWCDVMHVVKTQLKLSEFDEVSGPSSGCIFAEFDREPVGSASLAQVHRARLSDGAEVAVKVQHRGIEAVVSSDLFIVKCLNGFLSRLFKEEGFSMAWAIDEFERNVAHELNFLEEAEHATRCHEFFQLHQALRANVHVPRVHAELTGPKLLVMDFSHGLPIGKLTEAVRKVASKQADAVLSDSEKEALMAARSAAHTLAAAFGAMCFSSGFVHCDPHPGNLLVERGRTAAETRLVILDHGLYCNLSKDRRLAMCCLWKGMVLQDDALLLSSAATLGIDPSTAELLPIYFTNRSMSTKAGLGQPITLEEKDKLKKQLMESGLLPKESNAASFAMSGLGMLAERLPADMLMVMRTMHLVAALHRDLGGKPTERFLLYADAAVAGQAQLDWFPRRFCFIATWLCRAMFHTRLWLKEAYLKFAYSRKGACEHFSIARSLAEIAQEQAHLDIKACQTAGLAE